MSRTEPRYWTQPELIQRERELTVSLTEVMEVAERHDPAWERFAPKLAAAFVKWQVTDYISPTGVPKTKGPQECKLERAAWDALARVAMDWPGYPVGAGTGGPALFCMEHDPGISGELRSR